MCVFPAGILANIIQHIRDIKWLVIFSKKKEKVEGREGRRKGEWEWERESSTTGYNHIKEYKTNQHYWLYTQRIFNMGKMLIDLMIKGKQHALFCIIKEKTNCNKKEWHQINFSSFFFPFKNIFLHFSKLLFINV